MATAFSPEVAYTYRRERAVVTAVAGTATLARIEQMLAAKVGLPGRSC